MGFILRSAVLATFIAVTGCAFVNVDVQRKPGPLAEYAVEGKGGKKILLVDIAGTISNARRKDGLLGGSAPSPVAAVRESLRKAEDDASIAGIILRIDSPGGTVSASDTIYHELKSFRERKKIPMTACITGFGTSGALYAAAAADTIAAHPTAVTGSIGVIFLKFNVEGLMAKIGVSEQSIKSARLKDMLSPFREATTEERAIAQEVIDRLARRFVEVVTAGRPKLTRQQVEVLADGRVYTAEQALAAGLVDRIGYLDEEIEAMKHRLGLTEATIVRYGAPGEYRGSIYGGGETAPDLASLVTGTDAGADGGFLYLWRP